MVPCVVDHLLVKEHVPVHHHDDFRIRYCLDCRIQQRSLAETALDCQGNMADLFRIHLKGIKPTGRILLGHAEHGLGEQTNVVCKGRREISSAVSIALIAKCSNREELHSKNIAKKFSIFRMKLAKRPFFFNRPKIINL